MNNLTQHRSWIPGMRGRAAGAALALAVVLVSAVITTQVAQAQTFNTLYSFCSQSGCADGYWLTAGLIQATDGNFYGTTEWGGIYWGTVFKITPSGKLTTLYSFCNIGCTDGYNPNAGLVQATNGNFYGTTLEGGANGEGTVFKITPSGELTTLYSFCSQSGCTDGALPYAGLIQATDGNFYGTTYEGGTTDCNAGCGTVFKITPSGKLTTLHSFNFTDGANPYAALVQATNGNLYGTTYNGGAYGPGTVFKITPSGELTTLHSFEGADGYNPYAGLVQAGDGNFYGTTYQSYTGAGTVFKITPSGKLTTLYSFCSQGDCTDGAYPYAGLVQATDGNFYGTTFQGGADYSFCPGGCGTVFEITAGGKLTTLHSFDGTDGDFPYAGLVQDTNGTFYGTTRTGGANGEGTVFSLSVGLGLFVETQPTSGKVGAAVKILGTNLKGATSVTFNGTAATFTVVASSLITTTAPAGATTGTVKVATPSSTLTSNVTFRVTPQITSFTPPSGPVGTSVTITGISLTQTTEVTFGGVKATTFTVNSDTQVTATVPTGAKTGKIGIMTPGGTATSATSFTVTT
jgi:uncharacterized repeat protein (TIGR03803 family)